MKNEINFTLLGGKILNSGINQETRVVLIQTFRKHSKNNYIDVRYVIQTLRKLMNGCSGDEKRLVARLIACVEYESDIATDRILNPVSEASVIRRLFNKKN
jgi:hypothetical protein